MLRAHPYLAHLAVPVTELGGVGPERAALLRRLQIHTAGELLLHRPRRYEDRRRMSPIAGLVVGKSATVYGQVVALGIKRYARGMKSVFELILDDGTARLHCRWWNLPFMQNYFTKGNGVLVFGKPNSLRPRTIDHPETEVIESGEEVSIHLNRIAPIYPLTEGLTQRWLRALIWRALEQFTATIREARTPLSEHGMLGPAEALQALHFPAELPDAEKARQRFALEEFIVLQLTMQERRRNLQSRAAGHRCDGDNRLIKPFLAGIGFSLTRAQTRVLREIRRDLALGQPMRRLLQGDVGSGKTVVAGCAALMVLESGFNVAMMAPTEILAEQHFQNFQRSFERLGVGVQLRPGSHKELKIEGCKLRVPAKRPVGARSAGLEGDAESKEPATSNLQPVTLVIGTHALIAQSFELDRLGLVIIDEQHKFGVAQRERLVRKGSYPHLLVMTATPIPRTLGLTLYGDLDISLIDEVPAGRAPIRTFVRGADKLPKVWTFVRSILAAGRQAYVVYPRIEEGGTSGLKAVTKEWEALKRELAPFQVGLLHGRLKAVEKDSVMTGFRENRIHVLLTTPLIEVGVNVPNATVMLIENAEQFGLAQLHQLRGRIGRGAHESHCILVASARTPEAQQRLEIVAETSDGFEIAEADLRLRGPGDFLGHEQSGLPPLRFGDLAKDLLLVEQARDLAKRILEERAKP